MEDSELSLSLDDYESLADKYIRELDTLPESDLMLNDIFQRFKVKEAANQEAAIPPEIILVDKVLRERNVLNVRLKALCAETNILSNILHRINNQISMANERLVKDLNSSMPPEHSFANSDYSKLHQIPHVMQPPPARLELLQRQGSSSNDPIDDLFSSIPIKDSGNGMGDTAQ